MQVADRGPKQHFMTRMAVLLRGETIAFGALALQSRKAELVERFAQLGANATVNGWTMTVDLCPSHRLVFTAHSSKAALGALNFLNFELRVPGCHDSYGGLLGQTYQCRWAQPDETFQWSRDREEQFRVPTLATSSGAYSPTAECVHEGEAAMRQ